MTLIRVLLNRQSVLDLSGASITDKEVHQIADGIRNSDSLTAVKLQDIPALQQQRPFLDVIDALKKNRSIEHVTLDIPFSLREGNVPALDDLVAVRPNLKIKISPFEYYGNSNSREIGSPSTPNTGKGR